MHTQRTWTPLGAVSPTELGDARLQLHWALQPVSGSGTTHSPAEEDWGHTTFAWLDGVRALAARPLPEVGGARVALRPEDLTLLWLDPDGRVDASLALHGRQLGDATMWIMSSIAERSGEELRPLELAPYELPEHPVERGAPFSAAPEHLAELARWYADADLALQSVAAAAEASDVRTWPHHVDIATLFTLDPERGPEDGPTIGVGMTPGDASYAEPYAYVTPHPPPEGVPLPQLPVGGWHTQGWLGAVLCGSELVAAGDAQQAMLERFLDAALDAARRLLG